MLIVDASTIEHGPGFRGETRWYDDASKAVVESRAIADNPNIRQVSVTVRDDRHDDHARPWAIRHFARRAAGDIEDTGWRGWPRGSNQAQAVSDRDLAAFIAA